MLVSKRIVAGLVLAALALLIASVLSFGAIRRGFVAPPTGTLRLGPVTVLALPPCPTIPGNLFGPGRRCGSASPWALWAIVRWPSGSTWRWHIASVIVDP